MKTIIIDGVEYNLTPKIMFKNGTWLVENEPNNYARFIQILEVVDVQGKERYRISRDLHNDEDVVECRFIENNYHSFTIQDAKDGDVLADNVGVILFKSIGDNNVVNFHAYFSGLFAVQEGEHYWGHIRECTLSPTTKEQRERFFAAMHDAGYEWDAEKKELKKIEQEPIDCNEEYYNEELKNALFTSLRDAREQYLREKNAAWSDEDELKRSTLIHVVKKLQGSAIFEGLLPEELIAWLKSLQQRIGG